MTVMPSGLPVTPLLLLLPLLLLWTSVGPACAVAGPEPPLPPNTTWQGRPQFWRVAEVNWSMPDDAVYSSLPVRDAHHCSHLCLRDRSCAAADLVTAADGLLSCRLAARRGSGTEFTNVTVAAFVRLGRAEFGERCLTDDECWQAREGAVCVDGVCACSKPALTARGVCTISDCTDLSGLDVPNFSQYWLRLDDGTIAAVFCNSARDGGGWTLIQRRKDDPVQVDFYRYWHDYRDGFGDVSEQFWLGNELIHRITSRRPYELMISMKETRSSPRTNVRYSHFAVASEADCYRLSVSGFSGAIPDSLIARHNGRCFSTKDRDNDEYALSCSRRYKGGWWYSACHTVNLNGFYWKGQYTEYASGVVWYGWLGYQYSLEYTSMMIRPADFAATG